MPKYASVMWTQHFTPRIMDRQAVPVWTNDRLLCHETHRAPILRPLPRRCCLGVRLGGMPTSSKVPRGVQCQLPFSVGAFLLIPADARHPAALLDFNLCFPEGESSGASSQVFCSHWTFSSVKQLLKPSGHLFFQSSCLSH